jgi:ornithine cyclodeaminase
MRIFTLADLQPLLNKRDVLETTRAALIAHAKGQFQSPMPGELTFEAANGDCHIKYGHQSASATFAIKVSTGFYDNPKFGRPANNGLTLVFDAVTGEPTTLFQDEGWLTAWRTAAATALSVAIRPSSNIGIIGTGLQGQLAARWIMELLPQAKISLCGRDTNRTEEISTQLGARPIQTVGELMKTCNTIVTATPATAPVFDASQIRPGMHFVGVGADSAQKHELPIGLFSRASHIILDDHAQCSALGDFGKAARAGLVCGDNWLSLGDALEANGLDFKDNDVSVVDLTGLAAQDIAIAGLFAGALEKI